MPMISIIVPVYNSYDYLERCFESILKQTYTDFELIVINDGSTDNSELICQAYCQKDKRIRFFSQKNAGQAAARNRGIREAAGEWVCFIDSDDCVNQWMLEYLIKAANDASANMSICNYIQGERPDISFFLKPEYSYDGYDVSEQTLLCLLKPVPSVYSLVCTKIIRKDIVLTNLFTEGRIYEDNAVAPKWFFESKRISVVNSPLYFYTVNYNGTTKSKFTLKNLDLLWAVEEQMEYLNRISFSIMEKVILMNYINYCYSLSSNVKNLLGLKRKSKQILSEGRRIVNKHKNSKIMNYQEKKKVNDFLHPVYSRLKRKFIKGD